MKGKVSVTHREIQYTARRTGPEKLEQIPSPPPKETQSRDAGPIETPNLGGVHRVLLKQKRMT